MKAEVNYEFDNGHRGNLPPYIPFEEVKIKLIPENDADRKVLSQMKKSPVSITNPRLKISFSDKNEEVFVEYINHF